MSEGLVLGILGGPKARKPRFRGVLSEGFGPEGFGPEGLVLGILGGPKARKPRFRGFCRRAWFSEF